MFIHLVCNEDKLSSFLYIYIHSVHQDISPPSKTSPPLSCQTLPPLNLQAVQAPLFRQSPLYIGFL